MTNEIDIAPKALAARLGAGGDNPFLLDVRTADECGIVMIDGAVNIPVDVVHEHLDEIPADRTVITICHHGMRSKRAAMFLRAQGFSNVYSLSGGMDLWAVEIDQTLPRY